MVVSKRKTTLRSLTARLLVLGDKQVGKSASIVRYTTGRYIEEYSQMTNDWLYRHSLGFNAKQNVTTSVELLEQKDIHFSNSSNFFASQTSLNQNSNINRMKDCISNNNSQDINNNLINSNQQSLASRVALDQKIDNEMHSKQEMLNKLHWANAYIVIYAINDSSTFNKAIKYLNLIANNINSPGNNYTHHQQANSNTSSFNSSCNNISSNSNSNSNNNNSSYNSTSNNHHHNSSGLFNRLSPIGSYQGTNKLSPNHHQNNCRCINTINSTCNNATKRPILLLANKRDFEKSGARQVSTNDGRMLAMRHQAMFAEVSIAESNKLIETTIDSLIDQIEFSNMHLDHLNPKQQQQLPSAVADIENQPKLVQWCPSIERIFTQAAGFGSPVWGTLVKTQAIGSSIAQSNGITCTRQETDVRLIKPIGLVAKSVDAKVTMKPLLATCQTLKGYSASSSDLSGSPKTNLNNKAPNSNRYETLKSSFKRASMAIASGKTLAKNLTKPISKYPDSLQDDKKKGQVSQSSLDSVSESIAEQNNRKISTISAPGPTNWIKTHIRLNRHETSKAASSSDPKLNTPPATGLGEHLATNRFKKQLFKYSGRRKTVAFEQIKDDEDSCIEVDNAIKHEIQQQPNVATKGKLSEIGRTEDGRANSNGSCSYNSMRSSSGRSSSSLSNTDTSYSSFFLCNSDRVPSSSGSACSSNYSVASGQQVRPLNRCSSRSNLSRASTSAGSGEETSGDELLTNSNTTINSRIFHNKAKPVRAETCRQTLPPMIASAVDINNNNNAKKQNQIAKSVHCTLTNLTRSSNITAKRSFCSALFKQPTVDTIAPMGSKTMPAIKQK